MGLLTEGNALSWSDTHKNSQHVKNHGIRQFINIYHLHKDRRGDPFLWGDELEYQLVKFNKEKNCAQLYLHSDAILSDLKTVETHKTTDADADDDNSDDSLKCIWHVEFGSHMVESTPFNPYNDSLSDLNLVEKNMVRRRESIEKILKKYDNVAVFLIPSFPRLGAPHCLDIENFEFNEYFIKDNVFSNPEYNNNKLECLNDKNLSHLINRLPLYHANLSTNSVFMSDAIILQNHPRFLNLAKNIRLRRGSRPSIYVPVWKDVNTSNPFIDSLPLDHDEVSANNLKPNFIYMDSMAFGMSCCSLQVTMQASDLNNAKKLYDQLIVLTPIMLAVSAGSPVWKGILSDIDCRWKVISQSVDDRTLIERSYINISSTTDEKQNKTPIPIPKSRYDCVSMYLSEENDNLNEPIVIDQMAYKQMLESGVDEQIARHIAHLFIRDPLVILEHNLIQNDKLETNHFENIQSTNWQSLRFKPPSLDKESRIGWRVEFRTMECQLTDFENAAYAIFVSLIGRALIHYNYKLSIPISLVTDNMENATKRNAVNEQFFHFKDDNGKVQLMKINDIINGKNGMFIGLLNIVKKYLNEMDASSLETTQEYLDLIGLRASGKIPTLATWMRQYILQHVQYQNNSLVNDSIVYDMLKECEKIVKNNNNLLIDLYQDMSNITNINIPNNCSNSNYKVKDKVFNFFNSYVIPIETTFTHNNQS